MIKKAISLVLSVMMIVSVFVLYGIYGEKDIPDVKEAYNLTGYLSRSLGFVRIDTYNEWLSVIGEGENDNTYGCVQNLQKGVDLKKAYEESFFSSRSLVVYSARLMSGCYIVKYINSEIFGGELIIYVKIISYFGQGMQTLCNGSIILEISKEFLSDVNSINVEVLP